MPDLLLNILFIIGVSAVIIVALIATYYIDMKRRAALQAACASRGWQYQSQDLSLVGRWSGQPFGRGERRQARNILRGTHQGRPHLAFDYSYQTKSTDSNGRTKRTTHRYAVLALDVGVALPALAVSSDNALKRALNTFTNADINFESDDFNRAFTVTADDPKFAYDILHPQTMDLLLNQGRDTSWRFEGKHLLAVRSGNLDLADVDSDLTLLDALIDAVPAYVWAFLGQPEA